jgi:hypothetical protein
VSAPFPETGAAAGRAGVVGRTAATAVPQPKAATDPSVKATIPIQLRTLTLLVFDVITLWVMESWIRWTTVANIEFSLRWEILRRSLRLSIA